MTVAYEIRFTPFRPTFNIISVPFLTMRSSTTFLAATVALLSFIAATPLERRYQECRAPQQWHICGDGWSGCCSTTPCKGPGKKSYCPDEQSSQSSNNQASPTVSASSAASSGPALDTKWQEKCKEDDSNCNWKPTYHYIKNYDEKYARNSTSQLFAWKDADTSSTKYRRDAIGVFADIPAGVKNCSLSWYKPEKGIFYGTSVDGTFNLSIIDTGGKKFADAVGGAVNWKNTKKFFGEEEEGRQLDLGNWGWTVEPTYLNSAKPIDCQGKSEVVVHFELAAEFEGAVIVDQVSELGSVNGFVQRAGWVLRYDGSNV